jgi:DNA-3-methyladenine glycosylase
MSILSRLFYYQPTLKLARQLLGKFLLRRTKEGLYVGKIVETEAYLGMKDLACHASKGKTERNKMMFGPPGQAYIYFIYGMHHCLNIVTGKKENPCAVLIRALEPIKLVSVETRHCNTDAINRVSTDKIKIVQAKRIGVDYAGEWKDKPWRFYIKGNRFVSKK